MAPRGGRISCRIRTAVDSASNKQSWDTPFARQPGNSAFRLGTGEHQKELNGLLYILKQANVLASISVIYVAASVTLIASSVQTNTGVILLNFPHQTDRQ